MICHGREAEKMKSHLHTERFVFKIEFVTTRPSGAAIHQGYHAAGSESELGRVHRPREKGKKKLDMKDVGS